MTVRLYDTATKSLVALPDPPAKVGMYVCGPTVYQRAHIGNAVPFVIFAWLRNWLRERGYDVTYVHNITDVNDKIYEAAPGASAARAREATQWYLDDTRSFGLEMPDEQPLATETIPEIVALIEELIASGHAYEAGGDVYFRVASFESYGALSGQRPDQVEEQEPSPLKEDARDFALWKATKEGEDTSWGSPWGPGRPGWHIECSAMAEKTLGPEFLIHGGGLDLVFPHHENERAQSQAVGRPFARIWMHNGLLRFTGEKMSKSVGNVATIQEVIAGWGREVALLFLMTGHWRKPLEFSEEAMTAAGVQVESLRNALRGETRSVGDWDELGAVLDDDFNTPAALAIFHRWAREGALAELRRGLAIFGLGELGDASRRRPRSWRSPARGPRRGRRATLPSRIACATRSPQPAGKCGTQAAHPRASSSCRCGDPGAHLRPKRRARGVARAAGRCSSSGSPSGRQPRWTGSVRGRGPRSSRSATSPRRRRAPITRASSPGRARIRTPIRGSSPAGEMPLLACLDQVTDPRNLGAVIRSAAGAGATGVIVPAHGAAQVTPAVCRSSAGTVEHLPVAVVPNLARYLAEIKRDDLWSYAATADAPQTMWQADLTGGVALVFGAEGKGVRPLVRKTCDASISIPLAAGVESLNVSVAAAVLLYEARRQRGAASSPAGRLTPVADRCPSRRSTCSTATTCSTRGGREDVRELVDELASFVAMSGARGVVVFDGVGEEHQVGPLSVRYAPDADTLLERLAAEPPARRARLPRLVRRGDPRAPRARRCARCPRPRSCATSSRRRTSRIRRHDCATGSTRRPGRSSSGSAAGSRGSTACRASPERRAHLPEPWPVRPTVVGTNTCSDHRAKFAKGL